MSISTPLITAEQLFDMPEDGLRRELVNGEISCMNPAGYEHGTIVADLTAFQGSFVRQNKLGRTSGAETGFLLSRSPDTVRAPDLAFVRQSRIAETGVPRSFFPGAPDLAVEVVSPNDRPTEVAAKVQDWLSHGTLEVWVVDPRRRTVALHRSAADMRELAEQDILESAELLHGFGLNVAEIIPTA